ncbi:MAG TPA: PadR family transcriptional regulator [Chloroflexota bacterium]|jgi:DNA-binding PadR family transcriptional regulator
MHGPHDRHHRHPHPHPFFGFFPGPSRRWADEGDFPFGRWNRRWGGGPGPGFDFFGGPGPGERFFGRGDLKVVILELLKDQPRHGYDIIRALEDRMRGRYRPSPGSVYPTLQMLEDLGYVSSVQQEGKKVYTITDEGRRYLSEQQPTVDDIRSRISAGWDAAQRPEVSDLMHEVQQLARALFRGGTSSLHEPERLRRLREIVSRARAEVEAFDDEPRTSPAGAPPSDPRIV